MLDEITELGTPDVSGASIFLRTASPHDLDSGGSPGHSGFDLGGGEKERAAEQASDGRFGQLLPREAFRRDPGSHGVGLR